MRTRELDVELLAKLLKRNVLGKAPTKTRRFGNHWEAAIAIGKDHVAFITLDEEALTELEKLI